MSEARELLSGISRGQADIARSQAEILRRLDDLSSRLDRQAVPAPRNCNWVDSRQAAELLGVKPRWVRDHRAELGGEPLDPSGKRPRWRFPRERIEARMGAPAEQPEPSPPPPRARRRNLSSTAELLPIKGRPAP